MSVQYHFKNQKNVTQLTESRTRRSRRNGIWIRWISVWKYLNLWSMSPISKWLRSQRSSNDSRESNREDLNIVMFRLCNHDASTRMQKDRINSGQIYREWIFEPDQNDKKSTYLTLTLMNISRLITKKVTAQKKYQLSARKIFIMI